MHKINFQKQRTVMIMAGGTGGHVFPGLAVAYGLQKHGIAVCWLGTPQGIEAKLIPAAEIPLECISINGLRGKGWQSLFAAPWKLLRAIYQALTIMRQKQPCAVLGMGGFAAGPGGFAARLLNKPLIIHEQNAIAGYTNRILACFAKRVLMSFPNTFSGRLNPILTGNPLREEFFAVPTPEERFATRTGPIRILVLGGSQGAEVLNRTVPAALQLLNKDSIRFEVRHSTGERALEDTRKAYQQVGIEVELQPFIKEMAEAYSWADLCICRAGALTIAELCAVGVGAIFVPYPWAVDDHQTKNAQPIVQAQAAYLIAQSEFNPEKLATLLKELVADRGKLLKMAHAARQLMATNATEQVIQQILEVCNATK